MNGRTAGWIVERQQELRCHMTDGTFALTACQPTAARNAITALQALRNSIATDPIANSARDAAVIALQRHVRQALRLLEAPFHHVLRQPTPDHLPVGVTACRRNIPNGLCFEFCHNAYGVLGRVELLPRAGLRLTLRAEIQAHILHHAAARHLFLTIVETVQQSWQSQDRDDSP